MAIGSVLLSAGAARFDGNPGPGQAQSSVAGLRQWERRPEYRLDPGTQLGEREILRPVIHDPQGKTFEPRIGIALVREDDNLEPDPLTGPAQLFQHFKAVQDGHPDIQQQQIRPVRLHGGKSLGPIGRLPDPMSGPAQPLSVELPQIGIILRHHDRCFHVA